jgi:hypothetical protein
MMSGNESASPRRMAMKYGPRSKRSAALNNLSQGDSACVVIGLDLVQGGSETPGQPEALPMGLRIVIDTTRRALKRNPWCNTQKKLTGPWQGLCDT